MKMCAIVKSPLLAPWSLKEINIKYIGCWNDYREFTDVFLLPFSCSCTEIIQIFDSAERKANIWRRILKVSVVLWGRNELFVGMAKLLEPDQNKKNILVNPYLFYLFVAWFNNWELKRIRGHLWKIWFILVKKYENLLFILKLIMRPSSSFFHNVHLFCIKNYRFFNIFNDTKHSTPTPSLSTGISHEICNNFYQF